MKKRMCVLLVAVVTWLPVAVVNAEISVPHIETIGVGEIHVEPDMAEFRVAVQAQRASAEEAKRAVDQAVAAFMTRLDKRGVARDDIRSANISIRPEYHHPKNKPAELVGYHAQRQISVVVRQLDQLNPSLDSALGEGINRIDSIALKTSQRAQYQEQARQLAIKDAMGKAGSLAEGFGETVAGIWRIRYNSRDIGQPVMAKMAMESSRAGADASYQDSDIVIRDEVEVIFRLAE